MKRCIVHPVCRTHFVPEPEIEIKKNDIKTMKRNTEVVVVGLFIFAFAGWLQFYFQYLL